MARAISAITGAAKIRPINATAKSSTLLWKTPHPSIGLETVVMKAKSPVRCSRMSGICSVPQIGEDMNIRGKRLHLTHDCIHHSGAR